MAADLDLVRRLVSADHGLAVVAVARRDGTVHTSVVNAGVLDDGAGTGTGAAVAFVVRGDAKKLALLRRAGRANVVFRAGWEWVAVEGAVDIVGPDEAAKDATIDLPKLLRDVFVAAGGSHDDWDEYDRVMAAERRTAVLVHPDRIVSN
jgi:PPOX class probable F420-dependent enzyme